MKKIYQHKTSLSIIVTEEKMDPKFWKFVRNHEPKKIKNSMIKKERVIKKK
jgi:hypothetical protein